MQVGEERLKKELAAAEARRLSDERTLNLAVAELKASNDRLRAQLQNDKAGLKDLDLSEATYLELRGRPEEGRELPAKL